MPKMKTHRGAAKRFKTTGTGKLRRRRAFRNHILEKKPVCDWFEIISENFMACGGRPLATLEAVRGAYPGRRLLTVHDLNYLYEKRGLSLLRHGWRMKQVLARNHGVVAISRHVAADVQKVLGWRGPLQVIHNGVRDLTAAPQEAVATLQGRRFWRSCSWWACARRLLTCRPPCGPCRPAR